MQILVSLLQQVQLVQFPINRVLRLNNSILAITKLMLNKDKLLMAKLSLVTTSKDTVKINQRKGNRMLMAKVKQLMVNNNKVVTANKVAIANKVVLMDRLHKMLTMELLEQQLEDMELKVSNNRDMEQLQDSNRDTIRANLGTTKANHNNSNNTKVVLQVMGKPLNRVMAKIMASNKQPQVLGLQTAVTVSSSNQIKTVLHTPLGNSKEMHLEMTVNLKVVGFLKAMMLQLITDQT